ncbi:CNNM transmembrane domain-containing protein [Mycena kentingensis (nom. inval.)]|nr:CNNM transmembrane domain-containing protein [Mycena kentingensis (nom. inval.)]
MGAKRTKPFSLQPSPTSSWMPPPPRSLGSSPASSRLIYTLVTAFNAYTQRHGTLAKREEGFDKNSTKDIVFAVLIPVLVLMSGLFAGLTLGYMSLDQTQLQVLSASGTPEQRKYAEKIIPIRKNGHLLLVTLLLANMVVNESLPIIADPVLGGGVQAVVVSTVLIIIFAEIIPMSICTRHGLYLGAKAAPLAKGLIYTLGIVSWPVAKLLELVLGHHHGIIYRRTELKELIAMHSDANTHGGDLKIDTVQIIGATLDLQEKVVRDAMTPIGKVFMLDIESRLDLDLLRKIVASGHSRIPVYEEIDTPASARLLLNDGNTPQKVKKILGILLVKQLVLLDPDETVPLRTIPLNTVPIVPNNQPLFRILDRFQEGRSHMAIVSRFTPEKKEEVRKELTRSGSLAGISEGGSETEGGDEKITSTDTGTPIPEGIPADAVLGEQGANEFLQGLDPAIMPVGLITLEDILEELIGEEIFDEFDAEGAKGGTYVHHDNANANAKKEAEAGAEKDKGKLAAAGAFTNFFRSRSVPPSRRTSVDGKTAASAVATPATEQAPGPGTPRPTPTVEFAENAKPSAPAPAGPAAPVRSASGTEISLEALLRVGASAAARGRSATRAPPSSGSLTGAGIQTNSPRGKFKSSPLVGGAGTGAGTGTAQTQDMAAVLGPIAGKEESSEAKRTNVE